MCSSPTSRDLQNLLQGGLYIFQSSQGAIGFSCIVFTLIGFDPYLSTYSLVQFLQHVHAVYEESKKKPEWFG
jgi:hypothetical protein